MPMEIKSLKDTLAEARVTLAKAPQVRNALATAVVDLAGAVHEVEDFAKEIQRDTAALKQEFGLSNDPSGARNAELTDKQVKDAQQTGAEIRAALDAARKTGDGVVDGKTTGGAFNGVVHTTTNQG